MVVFGPIYGVDSNVFVPEQVTEDRHCGCPYQRRGPEYSATASGQQVLTQQRAFSSELRYPAWHVIGIFNYVLKLNKKK